MKFTIAIIVLFSLLLDLILAKTFTQCELAREISNLFDMRYEEIQIWVCIARRSDYDTSNKQTALGSYDRGIFSINDRYWCSHGEDREEHNICEVPCSELNSDDITASVNCARRIYKGGDNTYVMWGNLGEKCETRKPDLSNCFESENKSGNKSEINSENNNNKFL
ncbi:lysozyme C-like [Chrysoperla carnea]|uniref:lysozyme C-like n=1 Tax=Chrysoperla carnea TaxID=189513 RepID=UPI001D0890AE|nr:lysozyme C-like [Chrysoperla carnea]